MYLGLSTEHGMSERGVARGVTLIDQAAEVKAKLAHTVRSNAKRQRGLTSAAILSILSKHLPLHVQRSLLGEMLQQTAYGDIKSVVTPSGQTFLYSLTHITPREAAAKGQLEEVKHVMAQKIRRDSRVGTVLTPLGALVALWPEMRPVEVCAILNEMQGQTFYRDLQTVAACSGALYLYSELHITGKYAALLARSAVNDACTIIADTVREESRIYPRPTNALLFTSQAYGIPAERLQHYIVRVLNNAEFQDIRKMVHPETEAVYLYSKQYMNEEHAFSLMKWLEEAEQATG